MPNQLAATLKRMDALQIAFVAKLGDKVKELSRLILQLDGSISVHAPHNQALLEKIHLLSHSLAGSAGTFKHTTVYHKAKAIESLCLDTLQKNDYPTNWQRLLLEFIVGLRGDVQISGRPAIIENFTAALDVEQQATLHTKSDNQPYHAVIVVDDDDLLVRLIQEQAKHFEYDVIPLLSTDDLEDAVEKHQPAAILIDVIFPDAKHSGIEIINQLKAKNKINCPVIFMSNRCDMTVRLDALRAGSDAFIVKPLEILELIRILDRLTQKLAKKKSRILIVDDEPLIAKFYQTVLIRNGFVCESVLNPLEVMNKALSFLPDAILLDINMPGCNGFELAEVIRQDDAFCHIPILFLTSANSKDKEIHAMNSGGDDFLDKNADLSAIIAIIKGHVQRYKELDSVLARLKRDEIRFRSVTSSSTDAIISTDEKNRIVFWNEGAESIFGYHALETIGQCLELIIPPEHHQKHNEVFKSFVENKTEHVFRRSIETTAIKKDKTCIDIELTYTEWASANEKFYTTIIRDVSQRKQIEHELHTKNESLKAIVSSSGEAIITSDFKGVIETANPQALLLFDYAEHELIGKNISMLIPAAERARHDGYLQDSTLHAPRIINQVRELEGQRKDGSTFALELNVSPMNVEGQQKFVGILRDISERKQFVNELLIAKAGAEAASQAKSQFVASMSHELRTPLNAIMGFTQILQDDDEHPLSPEQHDFLNYIYEGGVRLLALISDILDLARLESEALEVQNEKIALIDFTNERINQLKPDVIKAGLAINNLTDENRVFIETDKLKLQQVFDNLLSNAIKYNKPNGEIKISVAVQEKNVRLSIADTGKGIPEQLLPELFKPFSRLGAEVGTIEGTGIGLTLTQKLLEIMGGKIGVISKVGEGSTFWIEFQRA